MGARTRTVLHGIDQARPSNNRPAVIHDGHVLYETDTKGVRIGDSVEEEWLPLGPVQFIFDVDDDGDGGSNFQPIGLGRARVPAGFVITGFAIDVIETFTSSGDNATIAIGVESAGDLVAAVAIDDGGNPWDAGLHEGVPQPDDPSTWIKCTADRSVQIDVGVEQLTAGRLVGAIFGFMSEVTVTEEESSSSDSTSSSSDSSSDSSASSESSSSST